MTTNASVHDPVCHMDIDIKSAAGRSDYDGKTYYFCSPGCKKDFDADPAGILRAEAEYDHNQGSSMEMHGHDEPARRPTHPAWQFWRK